MPTAPAIKTPKNRVNFLILASDNDSKLIAAGTNLTSTSVVFPNTQVMIFVSFDPVHKQAYVISIPRDLWVTIPGYGDNKIDTASGYANIDGAIKTVEYNFGVNIDHYAWVGLNGFIKIIDSIGGIDVNVLHPMVENDFPDDVQQPDHPFAYRRFFIPPGPQHLDGQTAELYVRARHSDRQSDFGRSQRQQQVLLLIKQKLQRRLAAGDYDLLPLITQDLKSEAITDIQIPELLGLAHSLLGLKAARSTVGCSPRDTPQIIPSSHLPPVAPPTRWSRTGAASVRSSPASTPIRQSRAAPACEQRLPAPTRA